jgi:dTDP-4-amino-4,6-dideoxygalactose transaminase
LLASLAVESGRAAEDRGRNAAAWRLRLEALPLEEAGRQSAGAPVWLRYGLLLPDRRSRDRAVDGLRRAGIFASELYPSTLGDLSPLRPFLEDAGTCPGAESLAARLLVLPTHAYLRAGDIERTGQHLERILEGEDP